MSIPPSGEWVEITVRGRLSADWAEWFEGLSISHNSNGETIVSGVIADQAVLHGMLERIRDLNLALVSVQSRPMKE